jgi:hypothetical protein
MLSMKICRQNRHFIGIFKEHADAIGTLSASDALMRMALPT